MMGNRLSKERVVSIAILLLLAFPLILSAQTAKEIISKMDKIQKYDTSRIEGSMFITDRYGIKQTDFISWENKAGDFLIEFTSAAEEGQKILRASNVVYLFFPDAEDLMRLQGSSLKQGMMGSNFSYEDMTEGNSTLDKYRVKKLEDQVINEVDCWTIELIGKTRAVPYYRRIIFVNKDNFLPVKQQYFSKSGKMLKELVVDKIKKVKGLWSLTELTITDKLNKNSSTRMVMNKVELNIPIDRTLFSVSNLTW